jgi:hypothetical protein
VSGDIKKWSFETFGSIRTEIKRLRAMLDDARSSAWFDGTSLEVMAIEKQLHEIYEREEVMYMQRSRQECSRRVTRTRFFSKIERRTGDARIQCAVFDAKMVLGVIPMKG